MKILLCTNAFENVTNGPAKFSHLLLDINHLYPKHEIKILTEDVVSSTKNVYKAELKIPKFLKLIGQVLRMFQYHKIAKQLKESGEYPFDLLVYNNSYIGLWSALKMSNTIGMINDEKNARVTFLDVLKKRSNLKFFVFKQFEALSTRFHNGIITNSDYLTTTLKNEYNYSSSKVFKLYKAIEFPANISLDQIRQRNMNNPVKILFIKNDYLVGGLLILFKALSKVNFDNAITIVGPWEDQKENILAEAEKFKLSVDFKGPLPQHNVAELLISHDILCVPSLTEALGVANMEALAHGIPVVSSNAGGIPEVLNNGECGWLSSVNNDSSLKNAIEECISNFSERNRKVENGFKYVRIFSKDNMLRNFIEICSSVHGK